MQPHVRSSETNTRTDGLTEEQAQAREFLQKQEQAGLLIECRLHKCKQPIRDCALRLSTVTLKTRFALTEKQRRLRARWAGCDENCEHLLSAMEILAEMKRRGNKKNGSGIDSNCDGRRDASCRED